MKKTALLALVALLAGCHSHDPATPAKSDAHDVIAEFLQKTPIPPPPTSVLDGIDKETQNFAFIDSLSGKLSVADHEWVPTESGVSCDRERITALRRWASSLPDEKVRDGYAEWLDYYSDKLTKAEQQLRSAKPSESEEDRQQLELDKKINAGAKIATKLPKVPSIQCPVPQATKEQLKEISK